ncbi:MAG: ABC transporter ATP-binding protein [Parachlamydiales bacterium]|nr:ABC transporter ATP-binding protein [Parachlamydiales bacterium]
MNYPIISMEHVSKIYQQGEIKVEALSDVNLTINQGEFTVLAGPSGSGKTTLLNLIGGLDYPTQGIVQLNNIPIQKMSGAKLATFRRDHIGFVFQAYNLIPVLTAKENIEYVMTLQKISKPERERRVTWIMQELGLQGMENRKPCQLSGGQQQRVAVARAMVAHPKIILADEPTANVDSKTGLDLINLMLRLNAEKGMTFLFSTHDEMIINKAHRIIHLRDGKIYEIKKQSSKQ